MQKQVNILWNPTVIFEPGKFYVCSATLGYPIVAENRLPIEAGTLLYHVSSEPTTVPGVPYWKYYKCSFLVEEQLVHITVCVADQEQWTEVVDNSVT